MSECQCGILRMAGQQWISFAYMEMCDYLNILTAPEGGGEEKKKKKKTVDIDTKCCNLEYHAIGLLLINIIKPVVDLLDSLSPLKSTST